MDDNIEIIDNNEEQKTLAGRLLLIAGTLLLGILSVVLFFENMPGVSIPIFVIAFYVIMLPYNRRSLLPGSLFGWFLTIPILMLSLTYLFFSNEFFRLLNLLALPLLIVLQTLLVTGTNSFKWYSPVILLDLFYAFFFRCIVHIGKPFILIGRLFIRKSGESKLNPTVSRVLVGLAVSLPILIVLIVLLSSADLVFGSMMNTIPELLKSLNLGEAAARTIMAAAVFLLSFSFLWSIGIREKPADSIAENVTGSLRRVWEPVTILTVTAAIDMIYVTFVVIQFAYLFGGGNFQLPDGYTYAEYVHRGFFELVAVTVINIGILAFFLSFTKRTETKTGLALRILYTVMIGCTFVMLFSAHFRMMLYEEAYGYTYLRMYTHTFMGFLLVLFVITLYRVWIDSAPLVKPYLVASIIAFVIINYMNVDALIAGSNIDRFNKTGKLDVSYLTQLSNDAVPRIAALAESNPEFKDQLQAFLDNRKKELSVNRGWQSFNLADYNAKRSLE